MHTKSRIHGRIGFSLSAALTLASLTGLALAGACGGDEVVGGGETGTESGGSEAGTEGAQLCEPLEQQACVCDDGGEGVQLCDEAGDAWGECSECVIPPVCGDALCEPDKLEDCSNCPEDCGICLDCAEAPSCEAAAIPGAIETHLDVLDLLPEGEGMPIPPGPLADQLAAKVAAGQLGVRVVAAALDPVAVADEHPFVPALRQVFARYPDQAAAVRRQLVVAGLGVATDYRQQFPEPRTTNELSGATQISPIPQQDPGDCDDPKLRVRVAKIIVHDESDLVFKDTIYCAIVSEAMPGAEIRVTPKTFALDNGDEYSYALAEGVVWGQLGEPVAPGGSLSMTYNCIEADGTGAFEEFLDAIADAALGADAIPGPYGWVLPVVGLAADIISAALALENDDHLFNASQIIPADLHLQMTQGVWWSVQRQGTFMLKNWHWELRMEAWGCTEDGIG